MAGDSTLGAEEQEYSMSDPVTRNAEMITERPRLIRMDANDNVAIVVNDFGLAAGTLAEGVCLRERVPQGHKVALVDLKQGAPVRRYDVVIGYAAEDLPAGSWVNERGL
jgi:galactarate dehydratase